jgi:hypothetical protein
MSRRRRGQYQRDPHHREQHHHHYYYGRRSRTGVIYTIFRLMRWAISGIALWITFHLALQWIH